jgi:hypothetical protein
VGAIVVAEAVRNRTNQAEFIGDFRVQRQQLADFDPGSCRANGIEVAAVFDGCCGLQIVRVHVRQPARQPDEDHGGVLVRCRFAGRRLSQTHHLRQSRRQARERTSMQKATAGETRGN